MPTICTRTVQRVCDLLFKRTDVNISRSTAAHCLKEFHENYKMLQNVTEYFTSMRLDSLSTWFIEVMDHQLELQKLKPKFYNTPDALQALNISRISHKSFSLLKRKEFRDLIWLGIMFHSTKAIANFFASMQSILKTDKKFIIKIEADCTPGDFTKFGITFLAD
ncbi:hypothetical protein RF11_10035 [Thelohanellus kitauei]|uniref:Uncharacterized protein n=1 Tax=Thelohanellus kitauei TaxID=669202 RepID=A0A0C2N3Q9_THEKT|nr:hypothetical protein RF11_10035 [Thelohanellus kitauei]